MTSAGKEEIRKQIHELTGDWIDKNVHSTLGFINWTSGHNSLTTFVVDLITASNQQLLRELEGQAVEVQTVQYHYENGDTAIAGFTNSAVPLSIIQDKLKEMK